jgi:hypothetical protein
MMQLYSREMAQPMLPPGMVYVELIQPTLELMDRAFARTLPGLDEAQKMWCLHALIGPLVNVLQGQRFFSEAKDYAPPDLPGIDLDDAIEHIALMAEAGARALLKKGRK